MLLQPVKWHESDECEKCSSPFFWNFKLMWEAKSIGGRQVSYWHLFVDIGSDDDIIFVTKFLMNNCINCIFVLDSCLYMMTVFC